MEAKFKVGDEVVIGGDIYGAIIEVIQNYVDGGYVYRVDTGSKEFLYSEESLKLRKEDVQLNEGPGNGG